MDFPFAVREVETEWVTLADGCRLAARLWLPVTDRPVPAVMEWIPYRRRDMTRERDEAMHRYFAGHGYAALRVDIRGAGDSDGVLDDEYSAQEQADAVETIAWIAAQPWCDGHVGMIGKSWGAFAALQAAAHRPPALKAIIAVCGSEDRYGDDAHYMGGRLLNENMTWGASLFAFATYPPDPDVVGERWRTMWLERLEHLKPFPALWMQHPTRDAYWRHGSAGEDLGRIACPVYAVGGWADAYVNSVPRLLAGLASVRRGLIGPWGHLYPHEGVPGPAIGFLDEALRWWDRWLREVDNGIEREPMLRAWMPAPTPPAATIPERAGRWIAEGEWPSRRGETWEWALWQQPATVRSPQDTGAASGAWCSFGGDLPRDQAEDDAGSLVFDLPRVPDTLEIMGFPEVTLDLVPESPDAAVIVRLCDVQPDGAVARVSYGVLALDRHLDGRPAALGKPLQVTVRLNACAYGFRAGHRIRVSVSTAYWPIVWPGAAAGRVTVRSGRLALPIRPADAADADLPPFGPPRAAEPVGIESEGASEPARDRDAHGRTRTTVRRRGRTRIAPLDLDYTTEATRSFAIAPDDPLSAETEIEASTTFSRRDWRARLDTRLRLTASADRFRLEATVAAFDGGTPLFTREWVEDVPRHGPDEPYGKTGST